MSLLQHSYSAPNRLEDISYLGDTSIQREASCQGDTSVQGETSFQRDMSSQYSSADSQTSTPDRNIEAQGGRPVIKRKVLRKLKGQVRVCDESIHSEDSGALSELEERLGWTDASILAQDRSRSFRDQDSELESEDAASLDDRHSSEGDAFEAFMQRLDRNENDPRPRPKSFIRPVLDHPHTRNLKKTDPVTKYFEYKQHWEAFKSRGEKDRKNLQWEIREQLQYQPPPPRPRRAYVPNTYVVPTDKKRSALRWEVRHDLARGLLPANNYRTFGAPR